MLFLRCKDVGIGIPTLLAPRLPCHDVLINQKVTLSVRSVFLFVDKQMCQVMEKKTSLSDSHLESSSVSHLPPIKQGLEAAWIAEDLYS